MSLLKTDTDTQNIFGPLDAKFYSGQDRHTDRHTDTDGSESQVCQEPALADNDTNNTAGVA